MLSLFVFLIGLVIGSFLNVVIYRLPREESIVSPPSHCPTCGTRLKAFDLVPVFSFLIYGGKCRYCGLKISWQYPLVELLTGLLFLAGFVKYDWSVNFLLYFVLVSLLIAVFMIDLKTMIIPNKITYPGIIIGVVLSIWLRHVNFSSLVLNLLIPAGFLLIIALIFKGGMGLGDVKLAAMIGAFIGWQYTLLGIFIGSLVGSIIGLILIGTGLLKRKTKIPFGPLISFSIVLVMLFGEKIIVWYKILFY